MKSTELALIVTLLIGGQVVFAQDSSACETDVNNAIALLEQAQEAAAEGNHDEAQDQLAGARAALDQAEASCGDVSADLELSFTDSYRLATENGTLTIGIPEGWDVEEPDEEIVAFVNAPELAGLDLNTPEPPELEAGQAIIIASLVDETFFGFEDLDPDARPDEIVGRLAETVPPEFNEATEPQSFSVNDRQAAHIRVGDDELSYSVYVLDTFRSRAENLFTLVMVLAPSGEAEQYDELARSLLQSAEVEREE